MSLEPGRVVGIADDYLWIETVSRTTCGSCVAQKGCGQGLMNRFFEGRRNQLKVGLGQFASAQFNLDDEVDIAIPDRLLMGAAVLVYLLPLITLIIGMSLAGIWHEGDVAAATGAALGFAFGLTLLRLHSYIIRDRVDYRPQVVSRRTSRSDGAVAVRHASP